MYWKAIVGFFLMLIGELILLFFTIFFTSKLIGWTLLITTFFFLISMTTLVILYFKLFSGDWENLIDISHLDVEEVKIPMEKEWCMFARVLKSKNVKDKPQPAIICHHGLSGYGKKLFHFAGPLAMKGYVLILPDARAHGESKRELKKAKMDDWYINEEEGIFSDFKKIIDYACSRPDVDKKKIAIMGHSMGGVLCLTSGLQDERVKMVVAMSPFYSLNDFLESKRSRKKLSEEWFNKNALRLIIDFKKLEELETKISPKYYIEEIGREITRKKIRLVHCKDDELALLEIGSEKIINVLDLPAEQYFLPNKGGHSLRGQETTILTRLFDWFEEFFSEN